MTILEDIKKLEKINSTCKITKSKVTKDIQKFSP